MLTAVLQAVGGSAAPLHDAPPRLAVGSVQRVLRLPSALLRQPHPQDTTTALALETSLGLLRQVTGDICVELAADLARLSQVDGIPGAVALRFRTAVTKGNEVICVFS